VDDEAVDGQAEARRVASDATSAGSVAKARRGVVRGFSRSSRRRMLAFVNSLNRGAEGVPLLVTLTYPGAVCWNTFSRDKCKRDLDAFLKRLRRAYPTTHGLWKLEPQRRGASHFHLLVFEPSFIPVGEVSEMWWHAVGSDDADNLKNGVDVRQATSWRRVGAYVAKYVAKPTDDVPAGWESPGRWWGRFGRKYFRREAREHEIGANTAARLRRLGARAVFGGDRRALLDYLSVERRGLKVFADEAVAIRALKWAEDPRWKAGGIKLGGPSWYRRRIHRRVRGSRPAGPRGRIESS
jgi:hypothetical protein